MSLFTFVARTSRSSLRCALQQRAYRIRPGMTMTADERDDRNLRYLEEKLASIKAKMKKDEAQTEEMFRTKTKSKGEDIFENQMVYMWERVFKPSDKQKLAKYNIHTMDELYSLYEQAENKLKEPGHPGVEHLEPRVQFAKYFYDNIPKLVAASQLDGETRITATAFTSHRSRRYWI